MNIEEDLITKDLKHNKHKPIDPEIKKLNKREHSKSKPSKKFNEIPTVIYTEPIDPITQACVDGF